MNSNQTDQPVARAPMLQRLDRFLLWLLTIEMGFVLLLGLLLAMAAGLDATDDHYLRQASGAIVDVLPFLALFVLVGYLANLGGAFWGLVLRLRHPQDPAAFPGSGHLFNWIYLFGVLGVVAAIARGF